MKGVESVWHAFFIYAFIYLKWTNTEVNIILLVNGAEVLRY